MKSYSERLKQLVGNRVYLGCILLVALLSYGFSLSHQPVGVDDLEGGLYVGSGNKMIASGRFGMKIWALLLGNNCDFSPYFAYVVDFLALFFLVLAAIQFSILFQTVSNGHFNLVCATLFSCLFISYPLINEIWEYTGANMFVCAGYFFDGLTAYFMYEILYRRDLTRSKKIVRFVISALLMMMVCSTYESLAAVYVLTVFMILFLQCLYKTDKESTLPKLIKEGIIYALPLLFGVILRVIIHILILLLTHLERATTGATEIHWLVKPFLVVIKDVLSTAWTLLQSAYFMYLPIFLFVLSFLLFVLAVVCLTLRRKNIRVLLMGVGMVVSVFLITLIQGTRSPYRTCQTFGLFTAFVLSLCYVWVSGLKRGKILSKIIVAILTLVCLQQSVMLSNLFSLNYERSEIEKDVVKTIAVDLERKGIDKEVVFVGEYVLPETVTDPVTRTGKELTVGNFVRSCFGKEPIESFKIVQSNINSVLNWTFHAWNEDGTAVERLFRYCGHEIDVVGGDKEILAEAKAYAQEMELPSYPQEGYISEQDDYVIVRMGEISPK